MTDIIKMDYPKMQAMSATFKQGVQQLETTTQQMRSIAKTLENGALLGKGGTAFADAINSKLCPTLERMRAKFDELSKDVEKAMADMKAADTRTVQEFRS